VSCESYLWSVNLVTYLAMLNLAVNCLVCHMCGCHLSCVLVMCGCILPSGAAVIYLSLHFANLPYYVADYCNMWWLSFILEHVLMHVFINFVGLLPLSSRPGTNSTSCLCLIYAYSSIF
jgi:hypothetical protein